MYALALELLHDSKKALFACALYVFNRQAVTHFMLIRMYMLLTLLTVLLALLVAKSLHRPSIGKDLASGMRNCIHREMSLWTPRPLMYWT